MEAHKHGPKLPTPGLSLVVGFANTVACQACRAGDALDKPSDFHAWGRSFLVSEPERVSEGGLRYLRRFRHALREVVAAAIDGREPSRVALRSVNVASHRVHPSSSLSWEGGSWELVEGPVTCEGPERVAYQVARAAVALLTSPERTRLRRCQGPGCAHFLFARTRTQLWCSSAGCGNRVRVARHYRRAKSPARKGSSILGRPKRT